MDTNDVIFRNYEHGVFCLYDVIYGNPMNPAESAATEGQVDQTTAGAKDSGATNDNSDIGASEMDTSSGGDAGFEGFDGGGFGDF